MKRNCSILPNRQKAIAFDNLDSIGEFEGDLTREKWDRKMNEGRFEEKNIRLGQV